MIKRFKRTVSLYFSMGNETKTYRMKISTYKRIRKAYPGIKGETIAEYFERVSKEL